MNRLTYLKRGMMAAALLFLMAITASADAPLRRPISVNQPAWFVHIDNWNNANPQQIIDLIPEDIKPYVVFNISMSASRDENTHEFNRVPDGYSTARSWLRVCAENNVWAMVQCASGGHAHFSDTDMRVFEEFYQDYPNFIGWNYAEQFWGFDEPYTVTFDQRLQHFADLMRLSRKYGGYTCISFCGNFWSLAESPLAMMKRNKDFAQQAAEAPQNLIICDKYTCASMFYEYESCNFGSFVSGYTTNFGIRFDQCGWSNPYNVYETGDGAGDMPAAASGIAPVLNNWMINGGTVNDGPELIWQQCFQGVSDKTLDRNGSTGWTNAKVYRTRQLGHFPQFDNVSIDLYRKILDGTIRIPTREEVVARQKIVLIDDETKGDNGYDYGVPNDLYNGLYSTDNTSYHDQKDWFKKTGRYPTIPAVYQLVDDVAKSIPVKVKRGDYTKRWPTQAAKVAEFNKYYPEEYTGNAFAERVENRWLIYNPMKSGAMAKANIPLQYSTCDNIQFTLNLYSNIIMKEEAEKISLYLNNYNIKDKVSNSSTVNAVEKHFVCDTIVINGVTSAPAMTWKDRADHIASKIIKQEWSAGKYTLVIQHNGALDVEIACKGTATDRKTAPSDRELILPTSPAKYYGPTTHQCEDFYYNSTSNGIDLAPYAFSVRKGFHGLGYAKMGASGTASLIDSVRIEQAGKYQAYIRYSSPDGDGSISFQLGTQAKTIKLPKTNGGEWAEIKVTPPSAGYFNPKAGRIGIKIDQKNAVNVWLDEVTLVPQDYKGEVTMSVDRYTLPAFSITEGDETSEVVYVNGRGLSGDVSVAATGEFQVAASLDDQFASTTSLTPDADGNLVDVPVYIRMNPTASVGDYEGLVTFSAPECMDHELPVAGKMNPKPISLVYDFEGDVASSSAKTPPATDVVKPTGSNAAAGVARYANSNMLRIYSAGGRSGSGVLELKKFTEKSTDYSVTWKQYNTTTNQYKCGVLLRGGDIVGTSSQGYTGGIREGYVFIAYNVPNENRSEFRIYKSTKSTSLNMLTNGGASFAPQASKATWYRASISGTAPVRMTLEYSTDGVNWKTGASTTDNTAPYLMGATQLVWGLDASGSGFLYDDITFNGITYDETPAISVMGQENAAGKSVRVNLAGQRVGDSYKGIVIEKGHKNIMK